MADHFDIPGSSAVTSYRDLIAWQRAMDMTCMVYDITLSLPTDERFGLVSQMRRCATSIPSNIAEGWGRRSSADYIRYLQMACGSVHELSTQAEICSRLPMPGDWPSLKKMCDEIGRILNGLMTSIRRKNGIADPPFKKVSAKKQISSPNF